MQNNLSKTKHKPNKVVPDKALIEIQSDEATYGNNIRLGQMDPVTNKYSRYKIPGNLKIPNELLPVGSNVIVGGSEDDTKESFVVFLYNSDGNDTIYKYGKSTGWQIVFSGPILSLRQNIYSTLPRYQVKEYFVSADMLEGILGWTDWIVQPRALEVSKSIANEWTAPIADWMISQIKRPPGEAPLFYTDSAESLPVFIADNPEKPINNIVTQGIQFAPSYTYWDNSESRIGKPSILWFNNDVNIFIPINELNTYLLATATPQLVVNNFIKAVNWYFRRGNDGPWLLLKTIDNVIENYVAIPYYTGLPYTFKTINFTISDLTRITGTSTLVANTLEYADAIPLLARKFLFAGSRGHWLNFEEDFDPIKTVISATVQSVLTDPDLLNFRTLPYEQEYLFGIVYRNKFNQGTPVLNQISIQTPSRPGAIAFYDRFSPPVSGDYEVICPGVNGDFLYRYRVDFGIPAHTDLPLWVEDAEIVFCPKRIKTSLQRTVCRVIPLTIEPSSLANIGIPAEDLKVKITFSRYENNGGQLIGFALESGEPFNYSADANFYIKIRSGYILTAPATYTDQLAAYELVKEMEFKVTGTLGTIVYCELTNSQIDILAQLYPNAGYLIGDYGLFGVSYKPVLPSPNEQQIEYNQWQWASVDIEIYRKTSDPGQIFYGTGLTMSRSDLITGTTKSWYGDAFLIRQEIDMKETLVRRVRQSITISPLGIIRPRFISVSLANGFSEVWDADYGQPNILNPTVKKKRKKNYARHGEKYFAGTAVNGLFTVSADAETQVSLDLGEIVQAFPGAIDDQTGNRIKVLCMQGGEVIFLDRTQLDNQDATNNLIQSSNVYGTQNPMVNLMGCQSMFHAVKTKSGLVYFICANQQALCQWADNGIKDISKQDGFRSALQRLPASAYANMKVGVDNLYSEILISTPFGGGFAYNFESNAFMYNRLYSTDGAPIDMFLALLNQTFAFLRGETYEQNLSDENGDNTMFGQEFSADLTIVSNYAKEQDILALWKMVYMATTSEPWSVRLFTDQNSTGSDVGQLVQQESTIDLDEYVNRNGLYCATIKKDITSDGGKYDGDQMRGRYAVFQFTTLSKKVVDFTFIEIGFSPSNAQPK